MLARVVSGIGKAHVFLSLQKYARFFAAHLEADAFPGTLNVEAENRDDAEKFLNALGRPIRLEAFTLDGKEYGGVSAWRVRVLANEREEQCLLVRPDKTTHTPLLFELVAAKSLRAALSLKEGMLVLVEKK